MVCDVSHVFSNIVNSEFYYVFLEVLSLSRVIF